jgi:hypothetical protein
MKKLIKNLSGTLLLLLALSAAAGNDYKTLFNEGCADYARKDYAAAEKKLVLAQNAAADPAQSYMVSIRLANIFAAQKKYESAIAEARKVLSYEKCGKKERCSYLNLISDACHRLTIIGGRNDNVFIFAIANAGENVRGAILTQCELQAFT